MPKTGWKKIRSQLPLNKTFCTTPPPLIHRRFKHCQRTKQCFLLHRFSTQNSQYQYGKAHKYSILTVIELGPPVSKSSTGSQNFSTVSSTFYATTEIKNRKLATHRIHSRTHNRDTMFIH